MCVFRSHRDMEPIEVKHLHPSLFIFHFTPMSLVAFHRQFAGNSKYIVCAVTIIRISALLPVSSIVDIRRVN